jgi:hypothetical protein
MQAMLRPYGSRSGVSSPGGLISPRAASSESRTSPLATSSCGRWVRAPIWLTVAPVFGGLLERFSAVPGRAHPLAALGAFPTDVWNVFTRPGAEQRIRRLLTLPGQPSLSHAARPLGIRNASLISQVRQLEAVAGTTLLRTGPDGTITLTTDGEQFARDVAPALDMLAATGH